MEEPIVVALDVARRLALVYDLLAPLAASDHLIVVRARARRQVAALR